MTLKHYAQLIKLWKASSAVLLSLLATQIHAAADIVVFNADVYTVDENSPRVEAFAVENGKFVATGSNEDMLALADNATKKVDVKGATVTPGFIDAHQHFNGEAKQLELYVKSRDEWARRIKAEHESLPEGDWLIGSSWDHTIIDGVLPDKEFLDKIVGERPAVLTHIDYHYIWVNSAVLKLAGIKADTPVPPGGKIVLNDKGEPSGILKEGAMSLVRKILPKLSDEQRYAKLPGAIDWANSMGITGMHNMSTYDDFVHELENGDLTLRIWHGYFEPLSTRKQTAEKVEQIKSLQKQIAQRVKKSGKEEQVGPLFKIGFVKLFNDGVLSIHTAKLIKDYKDKINWKGAWTTTPKDLKKSVKALDEAGFQVAIHSIGNAAVRASLDAIEATSKNSKSKLPHRIEHIELLSKEDLPRFAEVNAVASMTPNHMTKAVAYIRYRIGKERENQAYNWQSLLNSGAQVIFGSDSFTSIHQDPIKQIADAIFRTNHSGFNNGQPWHSEEALGFSEALHAYTLGPAKTTEWANEIGSIEAGKWADFVIFDKKVPEPADRSLYEMSVLSTYFAGREVYKKP